MIRVSILAGTKSRALSIEERLADNDRVEIVELRTASEEHVLSDMADVLVVSGIHLFTLSIELPLVYLAEEAETPLFTEHMKAWLPAQASSLELIAAVEAAANNFTVLTPAQTSRYLPGTRGNTTVAIEKLTGRELQVLRMLAAGLANKEIAGQLGISDHTAKFHVAQILAKLGAGSRTEAVTAGIRRGLIPI